MQEEPGHHMVKVGWYIGPDMEPYIFHHTYEKATRAERIGDTVEFLPHHKNISFVSYADRASLDDAYLM